MKRADYWHVVLEKGSWNF